MKYKNRHNLKKHYLISYINLNLPINYCKYVYIDHKIPILLNKMQFI